MLKLNTVFLIAVVGRRGTELEQFSRFLGAVVIFYREQAELWFV